MAELTREEFLAHMEPLRGDIKDMKEHLAKLNGTVAEHKTDIGILKDRGTRDPLARIGAGVTAAVVVVGIVWSYLLK